MAEVASELDEENENPAPSVPEKSRVILDLFILEGDNWFVIVRLSES